MKILPFIAAAALILPASIQAQQPNTLPVVVDNRNGSGTYHQVTVPTDFWQHSPFTLATGQAYAVVNSTTGALITPSASAFYTANPPPAASATTWGSITGKPTTLTGYGLTLGLSDLPTIPTTKVSGLAASATTDTTNAANIGAGTLPTARLPLVPVAYGGTGVNTTEAAKTAFYTGFLKTVSSVGDGGANSLESIPTTSLPVPQFIMIYNVGEDNMQGFLLIAGTDAQDKDVGNTTFMHVRPLDYNGSSNAKVWVRKQ